MSDATPTEDIRQVLEQSLVHMSPGRSVSVPAASLRAVGIAVDKSIPDTRPVEFKVAALRKALVKK